MATKPASPRRPANARLAVRDDVGRRIREHREQSKLSLRELARRLGISPSAISQIETGKSRPSVSTLYSIVTELGMSLDELFSEDGSKPTRRVAGPAVAPAQLQPVRESDGPSERPDAEADFLYVVYDVGGASAECERFIRHSGREYGLVLSGRLQLTVGFDTYELGPGDSICFDSTVPHRLRNVGDEPAHGVWFVVGRQSDEQHRFPLGGGDRGGPAA